MTPHVAEASIENKLSVVRLGKLFLKESGLPLEFNSAYATAVAEDFILSENKVVGLLKKDDTFVGCIAGQIGSHPLTPQLVGYEVIWYVLPEHRGDGLLLLEFFERWCADRGCSVIMLSTLGDRVGALYKRRGYSPVERTYIKVV